jgi:hypothetical protein
MELGTVIDALYESEINCSIASAWDNGFTVKLGDEMNGFVAEKDCRTSSEAAMFLDDAAHQHYPDSTHALGRDEWERRHVTRNTGIRIVSRNEK